MTEEFSATAIAAPTPWRWSPTARGAAQMAAFSGGALGAAGVVTAAVLVGQALLARMAIPGAESPPPRCDGDYGQGYAGATPLRMAVLGDSTAAGYGVDRRAETPGALLATAVAEAVRRPVSLHCRAVVGAVSAGLRPQVEDVLERGVDLAIIMIGANDLTTRISPDAAVRQLAEAVHTLREAGAEVVVGTCPDLGTIQPIRPPLRWLARRWSRQLAAAQTIAVVGAGGHTVSLGDLLGPEFAAAPDRMFGADRFHPSVEGYAAAVAAILPVAVAAGVRATGGGSVIPQASGEFHPLLEAAEEAAAHPGTAVAPGDAGGRVAVLARVGALWNRMRGTYGGRFGVAPSADDPPSEAALTSARAARRGHGAVPCLAEPLGSSPVESS
jgi:lysophospholipase L1-like esterase